ncbi:conserved hypothetical protein [Rhizobium sp. RU35A]|uniref:lysylphosphatidylglycerol synthase transmembrane domain-containing protein n=1 Tax=Rhizobium sp. RU35A TaxID=1907414 RepID=UPI00095698CC|nr:lysylphosphatidylglycerol synthase transmembrane domain-containing protein [Rhizobium sp. RU35A]SIQ93730.1 conserved hypothetical protein [Rhizobium sp. RU35A]
MQTASRARILVRIAASLAALCLLPLLAFWIKPATILDALAQVSLWHVALGLVLVQGQIVLSALRWRLAAERLGQQITAGAAIREYYVASAVNQVVPGGMAGDVLRAWRMAQDGAGGWQRAARAVVYERLSGQIAFLALCLVGIPFWPLLPGAALQAGHHLLLAGAVLTAAVIAALLLLRRFSGLRDELAEVFVRRGALLRQGGLSLAVVCGYVALFLVSADAVGAPLPVAAMVTIVPMTLAAMLIPTGLGGWGTREAAAAALWPLAGLSSASGLSASLLYGALALAGALPGLVILALGRHPKGARHAHAGRRISAIPSTPNE